MNFLHPWAIGVGIGALALPILVHWLTRPRPRPLPLSTIRFVMQSARQKRARYRLRDVLILLLRAGAICMLGWAFARPTTGAKPLISPEALGKSVRVVLLDCSASMSAVSGGQRAFDRARADAAGYLRYDPDRRADLLLSGARPNALFDSASGNFAALQSALAAAAPRPQELDIQAALNAAAEIFSNSPAAADTRRELVIISDFQRTNWARADFSPIASNVLIQFESAGLTPAPANLGLLRVAPAGRVEAGRETRIEADVGNYSSTPRDVQVDIECGPATARLSGLCPAGVKTTLSGTVTFGTAGWMSGEARLVGVQDALSLDNQRSFVINVQPPPIYALLTRQPSSPRPDSSHFLELAIAPSLPGDTVAGERVVRLDPSQPDRQTLAAATLLVLDHPGKLSSDTINLLAAMVRRGKGMLYVAAENADATNLKLFADSAGADLKMPVEFQPPPANRSRVDLFVLDWKKDQPPFKSIDATMSAVAGSLRFSGGLDSHALDTGLRDDILATYSDRSACLVVTSFGAGTLAVLNADLSQSNLPSSPVFVPVVDELCGRLLAGGRSADAIGCGEPLAESLPSQVMDTDGLAVVGPDGAAVETAALTHEGSVVLWRDAAAGPPGVYSVKRSNQVVFAVATAVPPSESDLDTLDPQTLKVRLAAGRAAYVQGAADEPPRDVAWAWLLVACAGCMIAEVGVLKAFGT